MKICFEVFVTCCSHMGCGFKFFVISWIETCGSIRSRLVISKPTSGTEELSHHEHKINFHIVFGLSIELGLKIYQHSRRLSATGVESRSVVTPISTTTTTTSGIGQIILSYATMYMIVGLWRWGFRSDHYIWLLWTGCFLANLHSTCSNRRRCSTSCMMIASH